MQCGVVFGCGAVVWRGAVFGLCTGKLMVWCGDVWGCVVLVGVVWGSVVLSPLRAASWRGVV